MIDIKLKPCCNNCDRGDVRMIYEKDKDSVDVSIYCDNASVCDKFMNDAKYIQELIDKSIPMKPYSSNYKLSWLDKIIGVQKKYTCRYCGNGYIVKYAPNERNINNYCYDCGQKIDWRE